MRRRFIHFTAFSRLWNLSKMASEQQKSKGRSRRKGKETATGSEHRGNVTWTNQQVSVLIWLMHKHHSNSIGKNNEVTNRNTNWATLVKEFNAETGAGYDKANCKSKKDTLRTQWRDWKRLKKGTTCLGYNNQIRTIDAPDEWWDAKIAEDSAFLKFKTWGFSPEEEDQMLLIYGDGEAKGTRSYCPASSHPTSEVGDAEGTMDGYRPIFDTQMGDGSQSFTNHMATINLDDDFIPMPAYTGTDSPTPTSTPTGGEHSFGLGKRSSGSDDSSGSKKARRISKREREARALDAIAEGLPGYRQQIERTNQLIQSLVRSTTPQWTEDDAIGALLDIPDVASDSTLLADAAILMTNPSHRNVLKSMLT